MLISLRLSKFFTVISSFMHYIYNDIHDFIRSNNLANVRDSGHDLLIAIGSS